MRTHDVQCGSVSPSVSGTLLSVSRTLTSCTRRSSSWFRTPWAVSPSWWTHPRFPELSHTYLFEQSNFVLVVHHTLSHVQERWWFTICQVLLLSSQSCHFVFQIQQLLQQSIWFVHRVFLLQFLLLLLSFSLPFSLFSFALSISLLLLFLLSFSLCILFLVDLRDHRRNQIHRCPVLVDWLFSQMVDKCFKYFQLILVTLLLDLLRPVTYFSLISVKLSQ